MFLGSLGIVADSHSQLRAQSRKAVALTQTYSQVIQGLDRKLVAIARPYSRAIQSSDRKSGCEYTSV